MFRVISTGVFWTEMSAVVFLWWTFFQGDFWQGNCSAGLSQGNCLGGCPYLHAELHVSVCRGYNLGHPG